MEFNKLEPFPLSGNVCENFRRIDKDVQRYFIAS